MRPFLFPLVDLLTFGMVTSGGSVPGIDGFEILLHSRFVYPVGTAEPDTVQRPGPYQAVHSHLRDAHLGGYLRNSQKVRCYRSILCHCYICSLNLIRHFDVPVNNDRSLDAPHE